MEPFDITSIPHPKIASRDLRNLLLFTGALWAALLIPAPSGGPPGPFDHLLPEGIDKVVHGVLFALESYFLQRFFRHRTHVLGASGATAARVGSSRSRGVGWTRASVLTWASALTMAGLTELCQTTIPGRSADLWDVVADGLGIMAWWLWSLFASE